MDSISSPLGISPAASRWMAGPGVPDLVSVVLPAFNRGPLIVDALNSISKQTYRPLELVIVNDGSTDRSEEIIHAWAEQRGSDPAFVVRYFRQPNRGASAARNRGLAEARGDFIQFADSDDVMLPEKISLHVAALRAAVRAEIVWSDLVFVPLNDSANYPRARPLWRTWRRSRARVIWGRRLSRFPSQLVACLYRRSLSQRLGPLNESLKIHEDWEYNSRILSLVKEAIYLPGVQYIARIHNYGRISDERNQPTMRAKAYFAAVSAAERFAMAARGSDLPSPLRLRLMHKYGRVACYATLHGAYRQAFLAAEGMKRNASWRPLDWPAVALRQFNLLACLLWSSLKPAAATEALP